MEDPSNDIASRTSRLRVVVVEWKTDADRRWERLKRAHKKGFPSGLDRWYRNVARYGRRYRPKARWPLQGRYGLMKLK